MRGRGSEEFCPDLRTGLALKPAALLQDLGQPLCRVVRRLRPAVPVKDPADRSRARKLGGHGRRMEVDPGEAAVLHRGAVALLLR